MEHEEKKTMLAVIFLQFALFLFQVLWSLKEIEISLYIFRFETVIFFAQKTDIFHAF